MTLAEGFAETTGHPSCPSMGHPGRTHERPLRRAPRAQPRSSSFLDGASPPDDLVARAVTLGLSGLAVTDHQGLYGAVRFVTAAEAVGLHPVVGVEVELLDPVVPDPDGLVIPAPRPWRPGRRMGPPPREPDRPVEGHPARPRPERARLPGHRTVVKEDHRGSGGAARGASRAARPGRSRVAEPVPARLPGEPRGLQGGPAVHPGAPRRAHGRDHRAVGLSRRGGRATAPCGRSRGSTGGRAAVGAAAASNIIR